MDNKELLEEVRLIREDIRELHKDFYAFRGKAFGMIAGLSMFFGLLADHIKNKLSH
jgi:hypothetical protein